MRARAVALLGVCGVVAAAACDSKDRNFGSRSSDGGHVDGVLQDGTVAPSASGVAGSGAAQSTGGVAGNAPATSGGTSGGSGTESGGQAGGTLGSGGTQGVVGASCHECSSGDTRCVDDVIVACELQAGCWVWGSPEPCPEGGCLNGIECTTCTDVCSLDATACSDGELLTCGEGLDGCSIWQAPTPCPSGMCSDDETCFECDDECETGEALCSEGELSRCEEDAMGCLDWGPGTACETGACTTPTACAECDDVCGVGDTTCQAGALRSCVADAQGCLDWSSPMACATGSCTSMTECLVCDDECSGPASCQGRQLQTCVADANGCLAWSAPVTCPFVCNDDTGACEGACVPDDRSCSGAQPQVCSAEGVWEDDGAPCGTCMQCATATGTCVVSSGTCNDNNACTTGDQCQANGQCSGSPVVCTGADQCHDVGACVPATGCPAPTVRTGTCEDDNPCVNGETCQPNGSCGGGIPVAHTTACGNNQYCDGSGGCSCRTPSSWNLLSNPGFDGGLTSWTLGGAATYVSNEDVDSCSGSGSVLLDGLSEMVVQCVPAQPNTAYYLGFRFKDSGGASASGTVICNIFFLASGTPCDGASIGNGEVSQTYNTNNWIQGAGTATSPPNTAMIRINCVAAAAIGYYDQFYLSTTSPGIPAF